MPPPKPKSDYIETDTGNKVARRAQLYGTQHIILGGRVVIEPSVCIRGDLVRTTPAASHDVNTSKKEAGEVKDAASTTTATTTATATAAPAVNTTSITIGRYTYISTLSTLRPPHRLHRGHLTYLPQKIGEHVFIAPGCVIEAASIGDYVYIGEGAVVGRLCVLKEGVRVLAGCVVPAGMVVPGGCVVGGRPGRVVGVVGEGAGGDGRERWRGVG